jgi:hypothetical protein
MRSSRLTLALLALAALACRDGAPERPLSQTRSPNAQPEIVEALREDLARPRHPSDGGGRAWLDGAPGHVGAGDSAMWTLVYEAGPEGVAVGGMVLLQVSPFWGWSTPQVEAQDAPGYTTVSTDAEGVVLEPETLGQQLLGVRVGGRPLEPGEQVRVVYGAGPQGARADRYAERESRFWIAVDGDGDGVRQLLPDSPVVEIGPGPPARLILTVPSVARPGEVLPLTLAVLDAAGNAWPDVDGDIALVATGGASVPETVPLSVEDRGRAVVEVTVASEGTVEIEAHGPATLGGLSNPLVVSRDLPRIYWGDLHGHSGLSDGTGTPEDYYRYARDVAALDVAALTDHDHWGMRPLSQSPELWEEVRAQTKAFHDPGRFVTLLGYEWTSWLHGHRHVLYFGDEGQVLSSLDPAYESPLQLWEALSGEPALTIAHHTAGGPIATNWEIPPDQELEPVTEVSSVHGSSEAPDSPRVIYDPQPGHFARDALDRGYRLGFVGSGDSHDGHPGLAHLSSPNGGLVAILAEELTREGILEALRSRRVYATNGPRMVLHVTLDGASMGMSLEAGDGRPRVLEVTAVAADVLERIDVVRSGEVVRTFAGTGSRALRISEPVEGLTSGEYLYVRAVQADGGAAWSSPFFVD